MSRRFQLLIVGVLGFLAPIWWTWSVNQLHYQVYVLSGSPERPSQFYAWFTILAIPFSLGLMAGMAIYFLARQSLFQGWAIFWTLFLIGSALFSLIFGAANTIAGLFMSPGTWSFALGTAAIPLIWGHYAKRN